MADDQGSASERVRSEGATRRLAAFCSGLEVGALDGSVVEAVTNAIIDTLACSYAGVGTQPGEAVRQYARGFATDAGCAVVGDDLRLPMEFAALTNGTTAHALDADDGHRAASAHPGSAVIPSALAVGQDTGASGAEVVTAIAAGYEAMLSTAVAVQPSHRRRHFHATATCGCFGAAAAASRLLGLDTDRTAHAFGLAGTQAGGLFEFLPTGSMVKRFHPGRAGLAGVLAARLAASGFDGPDTIIEGSEGFAEAHADEYDLAPFDALGQPFTVTDCYLKPYACCRHVHGPIEAAARLRDGGVQPDDIERIRVETYESAARHDRRDIRTVLDAQMSLPYAVAATFKAGRPSLETFRAPSTDGFGLIDRIEVVQTDEMEAIYPGSRPATVRVRTTRGEWVEAFERYPRGSPENPLSESALAEKFHDFAGDVLPTGRREQVLEAARRFHRYDDVAEFAELL